MHRKHIASIFFTLLFGILALPAMGADSTAIVGTWRITSFSVLTLETNEVAHPNGENALGFIQYSPGGHMLVFVSSRNQKKPAGAAYTDTERADAHKSVFAAYAGRYTVEGNKVVHHVIGSWRPDWVGTDLVRFFEINGNKLSIKTAPLIYSVTGKQIVSTLTFEKVE